MIITAFTGLRLLALILFRWRIYNALRPYRSTKEELLAIADDLERRYQAVICAAFVREAAALYLERKKLKGDD